ncbi:sugar ABC transporter ATP-binding protein [Antarcticirhabdus aurantiaca]|uniref:Sugar ABC transporter ATP-binding protein n=1 Tax=Antarcticirhabdus aurantiaca TaxID=2606717 RepID=A0ACD4NQA5_9HYPH|nr:sugar ABC transporter ATP-binding protein [Antarcticirhabdus aurantiaca]WAJ28886.1 sugar ABC transporter ATP-binding protein [Jeongeuplla avenae]
MASEASRAGTASGGPSAHLELKGVTKRFGAVTALDDVGFDIPLGTTLGFVGENGAGKSTLMNILCGIQRPDAGTFVLHGEPVVLAGPRDAVLRGIFRVYQEQSLVSVYPIYQNLLLGLEDRFSRFGVLDRRAMRAIAKRVLGDLEIDLAPDVITGSLNFGTRQLVEIARVVAQSEVLAIRYPLVLLDEPTASLSGPELDLFYRIVDRLKTRYRASIVFVSHRLEEVLRLSDRIVVLKDGRVVDRDVSEPTEGKLHRLMVGRERLGDFYAVGRQRTSAGPPVLRVAGFTSDAFADVAFEVGEGEVVGIGGLVQSGKTELGLALFGVMEASGSVEIAGVEVSRASPAARIALGAGYVPLNRHRDGVMLGRSNLENIALPSLDRFSRGGIVSGRAVRRMAEAQIERLNIRPRDPDYRTGALSGGNQQKVVLAKWLAREPKLLVVDNPTRGVDAGAKEEIYRLLRELAERGCAILVISDDLVELIELSNRLFFLSSGRLSDPVPAPAEAKPREHDIVSLMF